MTKCVLEIPQTPYNLFCTNRPIIWEIFLKALIACPFSIKVTYQSPHLSRYVSGIPPVDLYLIFEKLIVKSSSTNWIFSLFRNGFLDFLLTL
jgi:hypothetical protein